MPRPNVTVTLGNGNLQRVAGSADGVAGLILTGSAIEGKLELNKAYMLNGTRDLAALGVTTENNYLVDKDVRAFYAEAGEGAELYLVVVPNATTLTGMCDSADGSPLRKLVDSGAGRVRITGCNKIAPDGYEVNVAQQIDADAIMAATKAQQAGSVVAEKQRPIRSLLPAASWTGETEDLFKPRENTTNRVSFVLASDDEKHNTAAIGQVLGRLARISVHQSVGRVADGAIATDGWATNGENYKDLDGKADLLHDAGYITYVGYPTKNGCYLNGDPTAAPLSDDYSALRLGRVIDKAQVICYSVFIEQILDTLEVDESGNIPQGACLSYQSMLENAIATQMSGEISSFEAYINPAQNILSSEEMEVDATIVPRGILGSIKVKLAFSNPATNS